MYTLVSKSAVASSKITSLPHKSVVSLSITGCWTSVASTTLALRANHIQLQWRALAFFLCSCSVHVVFTRKQFLVNIANEWSPCADIMWRAKISLRANFSAHSSHTAFFLIVRIKNYLNINKNRNVLKHINDRNLTPRGEVISVNKQRRWCGTKQRVRVVWSA